MKNKALLMILGGLLGIIYYHAFAPLHYSFLVLFVLPSLFLGMTHAQTNSGAGLLGFSFGFALHLKGLWWVGDVMAMPINNMAFMAYPARFGLALVFGFLFGLCFYFGHKLFKKMPGALMQILCFTVIFNGTELFFGHLFGGFPWYLIAYVFVGSNPLIQISSVFGAYGFGFIITFFVLLLGAFFYSHLTLKKRFAFIGSGLVIFAFLFNFGEKRIEKFFEYARYSREEKVNLHLLNTNIPMDEKWEEGEERRLLEKLIRQSKNISGPSDEQQVLIWPETAIAFDLISDEKLRASIMARFPEKTILIVGAFRTAFEKGVKQTYNTLYVLGDGGEILGLYDKHHLVPFGEFVPLKWLFPFMHNLVEGLPDFSAGKGTSTIEVEGLPDFSPLICYEAIFPHKIFENGIQPSWLLNITNDGWFPKIDQKEQHFDIHRMRAVEYGVPFVRVANAGVTTIIDALGRDAFIHQKQKIERSLLKALPKRTFFSKSPLIMTFLLFVLGLSLTLSVIFLKNKRKF